MGDAQWSFQKLLELQPYCFEEGVSHEVMENPFGCLVVWKKGGVVIVFFLNKKKDRNDFDWQNQVKSLDQTNYLVNYLQRCPSFDDNGLMAMVSFVITGVSTVCSTKALHLSTI